MTRYLVLTLRRPQFDPSVIPDHYAHLALLREQGRLELAGPFTDRTGGAYVLRADDLDAAQAIAHGDPLHATGASEVRVYEWAATACATR
ncbi:YciI family protein [Cognatiluteimonas telluris]|jgi:uncharacterized protein YciI|uniref:YciI family protein n=1 Tax=Cognatiluteimonas telluris TaxID=1104775 RepID=UPI00140DD504|nr:YciI family protein [Lysobacter telluris]